MPTSSTLGAGRNLPSSYPVFSAALDKGVPFSSFSFHGKRENVFRFANRYRIARAFKAIDLTGYEPPTVRAYGALFRHLITCSAAEQYSKILGMKGDLTFLDALIALEVRKECIDTAITADKGDMFFLAVRERITDPKLVLAVEKIVDGKSDLLSPLIRAVRHAFAHGDLAPGAKGAKPGVAQKFTSCVSPAILDALDRNFTERVSRALGV